MPTLSESNRAPAEITQTGYKSLIARAVASRFWPTRLCRHRNRSFPVNNRQNCLDCGATRLYLFHADFEHADAGIHVGPWERPKLPAQNAHLVIASRLIDNAIAAGRPRLNGRAAILDPGSENPLFQRRVRAAVVDDIEAITGEVMDRYDARLAVSR